MASLSLAQLVESYHGWALSEVQLERLAAGTVREYRRHHMGFLKHVGDVDVQQLVPFQLMQWGTTWHRIQALQRLFNWAIDPAGLVERNPFARVKKPRLGERKRILERVEEVRLLRAANLPFRRFLLCQRESIARPQEMRALLWEDWHQLKTGEEYFMPIEFKGRKRRADPNAIRVIPVTPRLSRLLARLRRLMLFPTGPILLNTKSRPWSSNAVRCEMRQLRERIGLLPDRRGERVVAYTFRHTAATRASVLGLRDRVLAELMGHSSTRTTARYQHPPVEDLLKAFGRTMQRGG